jgi:release factor glutamine methyltransferase
MKKDFYVYMLAKQKNGTIYKGISSNLIGRTWQHKNNIGSKFTTKYNVKKLVWYRQCGNWEDAVQWEKRLRRYSREWKINLIQEDNPEWLDLYGEITGEVDYTYLPKGKTCNDEFFLRYISKQLGSSLEARMMLKHITGMRDADLISNDSLNLTAEQHQKLESMLAERLKGKPLSKIIGVKEFYGLDFHVNEHVLDPRPDSETLIEEVLRHCTFLRQQNTCNPSENTKMDYTYLSQDKTCNDEILKILDLGTGSGCLILTLLNELPNAIGIATDISKEALTVARLNAEKQNLSSRVTFILSDWFDSVEGQFDIIISNPPYIESCDIPTLQAEVKNYDPHSALDGGADGLGPYRLILPQIRNYLKKGGLLALEHGAGQCGRIAEIARGAGFTDYRVIRDLGGHDRVFTAIHR